MIQASDPAGKYKMSAREWNAYRTFHGVKSAIASCHTALRERCRLTPGAWRDIRCMVAMADRIDAAIYSTLPFKQSKAFDAELSHTEFSVSVVGASHNIPNSVIYVDESAMIRIINRCLSMDCMLCEKSAKAARSCPLFKDISRLFPWSIDNSDDVQCIFAGLDHIGPKPPDAKPGAKGGHSVNRHFLTMLALLSALSLLLVASNAMSESYTMYAICNDSSVNVREKPTTKARIGGRLEFGWECIVIDQATDRSGLLWYKIDGVTELGYGWVSSQYLVDTKPRKMDGDVFTVKASGRVAAYNRVNGSRKAWVKPGTNVRIQIYSDSWCLTNKGYIKTDFLQLAENAEPITSKGAGK